MGKYKPTPFGVSNSCVPKDYYRYEEMKKMKQKSLLLASILLIASILLSACGGAAQTEEPSDRVRRRQGRPREDEKKVPTTPF